MLAVLCMFAIGVAVSLLPLYWTPYPFNPDGFVFAAAARDYWRWDTFPIQVTIAYWSSIGTSSWLC